MTSVMYNHNTMIDHRDQCNMEYQHQMHIKLSPSLKDGFVNGSTRPRLNTWPAAAIFDPFSNNGYNEETQAALQADQLDQFHADLEKRARKQTVSPKPTFPDECQQKPPQRRKLTTHKLSAKSYVDLITEAINSTLERRMTLAEIYKWMIGNVPCFKQQANVSASSGWKNAVRHTLSLHKRFKRVQRGRLQKPAWWTIQEDGVTNGSFGTVAGRSPPAQYHYQRRHSEPFIQNVKMEPTNNYTGNCHQPQPTGWALPTITAAAAAAVYNGSAWSSPYEQLTPTTTPVPSVTTTRSTSSEMMTGEEEMMARLDPGYDYQAQGAHMYLTRTTSDAVSYGSYKTKCLTKAYCPMDELKSLSKNYQELQGYDQSGIEDYASHFVGSPVDGCQSLFVQNEKGAMANLSVPMPLKVDVHEEMNQQTQTTGYGMNANFNKIQAPIQQKSFWFNDPLPQDLLGVQVDSQVQCNVAEVLAYDMKFQTNCSSETNGAVNDLYDLLRAGCALD